MDADFQLDSETINKLREGYDKSAEKTIDSLFEYMKQIDGVLGCGWKGKSSERYIEVISEYQQSTQEFVNEIMYRKSVIDEANDKFNVIYGKAEGVGDKISKMNSLK